MGLNASPRSRTSGFCPLGKSSVGPGSRAHGCLAERPVFGHGFREAFVVRPHLWQVVCLASLGREMFDRGGHICQRALGQGFSTPLPLSFRPKGMGMAKVCTVWPEGASANKLAYLTGGLQTPFRPWCVCVCGGGFKSCGLPTGKGQHLQNSPVSSLSPGQSLSPKRTIAEGKWEREG